MSPKSGSEHGTAYQIRNLLGRSNVAKNNMNACEDYMITLLYSYITSAAMEVLGMQSIDEWPTCIAEDLWVEDRLSLIVDKFVNLQYHSPSKVDQDKMLRSF